MDAGFQVAYPFIPKYVTEMGNLSESHYGALFALMAVAATLTMWPGGLFADRFGERWSLTLGSAIFMVTWSLMVVSPTTSVFILSFMLAGAGRAFIDPAFSSLISKAVPKESLGLTWGIFFTALGLLAIPAPYIGGWLYDQVAPEAPFVVAALLSLLVVPVILSRLPVVTQAPVSVQ
jgi:MFS family permease